MMKCECQNWARDAGNDIGEHHPNCPQRGRKSVKETVAHLNEMKAEKQWDARRDSVIAEIVSKYHDWEAVAGQDAQVEQDHEAFDWTMHSLLAKALEPLR